LIVVVFNLDPLEYLQDMINLEPWDESLHHVNEGDAANPFFVKELEKTDADELQ